MLLSLPKSGVIHQTFLLNSTFAWKTCVFKSFQESFLPFPQKKIKRRFNWEKARFNWDEYNFNDINQDLSEILS